MFWRILPLLFLLGGCASIDNVIGGTPEWFQEKRAEIRGTGYPTFADVPTQRPVSTARKGFALSADEMVNAALMFDTHPRAGRVDKSGDEIEAEAEAVRQLMGEIDPRTDAALSEADIAALRKQVQKHAQ